MSNVERIPAIFFNPRCFVPYILGNLPTMDGYIIFVI